MRFGKETSYLMLDIDAGSAYHPYRDPFAIGRILESLEPLGIYKHVAVSSSYSDGIHLYFPLLLVQTSWTIAHAAVALLESKGLKTDRGQLELFPNARRMSRADYNGHRLPLQAGSYLLNDDFQPIYGTQDTFVQRWRFAQNHNYVRAETIDQVLKQYERKASKKLGVSAQKFLNDLNAEIEPGWTGYSQTNHILGKIAVREYVFHHALYGGSPLKGISLQWRILDVAKSLPGFGQWCKHQHELPYLVGQWGRAIEASDYYPYGGNSILESDSPSEQNSPNWNQQQSIDARERIRSAMAELLDSGTLPTGVRGRLFAFKQRGIGTDALYKNLDLWHPNHVDESLKPAPAGLIPPVVDDSAEGRSLKAAPAGVIYPIDTISLSSCLEGAPQSSPPSVLRERLLGSLRGFPQLHPH